MKKEIHPKYYEDAAITCACGAVMKVGSTQKEMHVEICSQCHPFYTGKKKMIDTTGRVDRFRKLTQKAAVKKSAAVKALADKKAKTKKTETPKKTKAKAKKK